MGLVSELSGVEEYKSFRSSVPLKHIPVGENCKVWQIYDTGPRDSRSPAPLVCIPPISGTADVFFYQCLALSVRGYRVLSVSSPPCWSADEWCLAFKELLDHLALEKVHIFGAALGGFLAQKFAEFTRECPRVASLVLCNTFTDTAAFKFSENSSLFKMTPSIVLKRMIMEGLEVGNTDSAMVAATDFMLERLEGLSQSDLASRLTLNCLPCHVSPQKVNDLPITIIDVFDKCALSQGVREETYKFYPDAKLAHLKSGGNFPYLSRSEEVNLHLHIHLRNFEKAV